MRDGAKNILIYAYDNVNLGDDLFLRILSDRFPDVNFLLPSINAEYVRIVARNNFTIIRLRSIDVILDKICYRLIKKRIIPISVIQRRIDAVLAIGGSILMESVNQSCLTYERLAPFLNGPFSKPVFIIGCNYGPVYTLAFKEKINRLITKVDSTCFRDLYSYNLFQRFNNVRCAPDIVFLQPLPRCNRNNDLIGFSIIDLENRNELKKYKSSYYTALLHVIEDSVRNGKKVRLFSFCLDEGDLNACFEIKSLCHLRKIEEVDVISYNGNIDDFLLKLGEVSCLYATRFHALVLGLKFKIPIIPIVYSDKTEYLLNYIGIKGKIYDIRKNIQYLSYNLSDSFVLCDDKLNELSSKAKMHFDDFEEFLINS